MSRKRRDNSRERFVQLHYWMLRSKAWRALSSNAKALLIHVWERYNGNNNGQIVYGVRDAEEIGLSKDQAARALNELLELGFLKIRRDSSFTLKIKEAREWEITAVPLDKRPATKEFMSWSGTSQKISRSHQRDAKSHQRDSGITKGIKNTSTVALVRPSEAKSASPRSRQRDTSNIPCWDGDDQEVLDPLAALERARAAARERGIESSFSKSDLRFGRVEFGDAAKAKRIAR
jgi:hypothetical protein